MTFPSTLACDVVYVLKAELLHPRNSVVPIQWDALVHCMCQVHSFHAFSDIPPSPSTTHKFVQTPVFVFEPRMDNYREPALSGPL